MDTDKKKPNPKRDLLLHLYGEAPSESDLRLLLRDSELRSEYNDLSEAKFRMDHRTRIRPDAQVIDRIKAAAGLGGLASAENNRVDRSPLRRVVPFRKLLIPAISVAAVVIFGVGIGWFMRSPESVEIRGSENGERFASQAEFPNRPGTMTQVQDPLLSWDADERVRYLNRRIDSFQRANSGLDWGAPTVPLESLPAGRMPGLQTAGSNQ